MCGRFALTLPRSAVIGFFKARDGLGDSRTDARRHNIRPTQTVWVCALDGGEAGAGADGLAEAAAGERVVRPMRWGFVPHWAKGLNDGPLLINARSETIADKPAFKKAARERRCLVVADGFYEWRASAGVGKEPYWIHPAGGGPVAFAGVWRRWRGPEPKTGEVVEIDTVAIVTTAATQTLAPLHERLPLVIHPDDFPLWLGEAGRGAAALMVPPGEDFWAFHRVSTQINRSRGNAPDHPGLMAPLSDAASEEPPPPAPPDQGSLF